MDSTVATTGTEDQVWGGGNKPLNASYGKLMMWFFILSDALTFSGFLAAYGFSRFKFIVDEFVVVGERSVDAMSNSEGVWYQSDEPYNATYTIDEVRKGFTANPDLRIRTQQLIVNEETGASEKLVLSREESLFKLNNQAVGVVEGANLTENEYGAPLFADFFFFITGFHGFHVFSGVIFNLIIFFNVLLGTYEKRKSYEMVEKVGLYWHFVDLVWVFVFTFFYLV